jgi:molecular chaperone HtpG
VKDVRASKRLTESVSLLVSEEGDMSPTMERVMKMLDREVEQPKRILEVNPEHAFFKNLSALVASSPEAEQIATFSELLLDQALLAEGLVPDPAALLKRMQQVLTLASKQ